MGVRGENGLFVGRASCQAAVGRAIHKRTEFTLVATGNVRHDLFANRATLEHRSLHICTDACQGGKQFGGQ